MPLAPRSAGLAFRHDGLEARLRGRAVDDVAGIGNRLRIERRPGEQIAVARLRVENADHRAELRSGCVLRDGLSVDVEILRGACGAGLHRVADRRERLERGIGEVDVHVHIRDRVGIGGDVGELRTPGDRKALVGAHPGIVLRQLAGRELRRQVGELLIDVADLRAEDRRRVVDAADRHLSEPCTGYT
ncbi:hypothetical protein ACVWZR_007115 [Bradyrhizobium sp. i1.3.1]